METGERVMVAKGPGVARQRAADIPAWAEGMPAWWQPRDSQLDAVEKIAAEFEAGCRVVFLDSPTGTGKSAMGELTRRRLEVAQGLYVCTTKSLQAQVARDFPNARVLKGRANYTPLNVTSRQADGYRQGHAGMDAMGVSCADCDAAGGEDAEEMTCSYCMSVVDCPYRVARHEAEGASLGVLNTSYLLAACNMTRNSAFAGRDLVIADECDMLEDELLGFVEVKIGKRWVEKLGMEVPKKGSHMTTIRAWLAEEMEPGLMDLRTKLARDKSLTGRREHKRCDSLVSDVRRVIGREEGWVRDGDDEERDGGGLVLKPVSIEDVGERYLWRHADRWLCMSGTVVSAETMAESLGLEEAGIEWGVVRLDMPFRAENRRVKYLPVATMTRKGQEAGALSEVLTTIERVLLKHPGVNVLVHTHTYALARDVSNHLRGWSRREDGRAVITYTNGRGRDEALGAFKAGAREGVGGAVLVAPSMDRGVDLPGDEVRVQVIVKVPMASLGSRQVSERLRTPGGDSWYLASTVRTIMQMTGRGVRSMDDECVTYVLDKHFSRVLKDGKKMGMWPQWWLDALELGRL